MSNLGDAVHRLTSRAGGHMIDAPEAWSQGRTLYGGMTAALCYEAAKSQSDIESPLRSAQFVFAAPATGTLRFRTELLREGRSSRILAVDCLNEAGLAARATFFFARGRSSAVEHALLAPPRLPRPDDCPALIGRTGGFHDNFEMRLGAGSALFSGAQPTFTAWVRYRDPPDADAMTALLALADALPPAAMARFPHPAAISTITWTVDVARPPEDLAGWYVLRSTSENAQQGYSIQGMELWDASGTHLASGRQLVAIFV